jgi:hypothetical protein
VDDVVGDPVAGVLAVDERGRQLRALRPLGEQLAQEDRRALHDAPRLLEEVENAGLAGRVEQGHGRTVVRAGGDSAAGSPSFHKRFTRRSQEGAGRGRC